MLLGNILITGGAGFLGRGIMRRARRENWPVRFTIYSRNELNQQLCARRFPNARYVLGDVLDHDRLTMVMLGHTDVIHAAALKFIPEGEFNASEVVRVNIDGARSVIAASRSAGVDRVVGISTDKAAQPVNVYGMSKAIMERLFADWATDTYGPKFTTCRYGNVIGSTGSVVPAMIEQHAQEGIVQITNPDMTRFWMSVDQAVDTIVEAFDAPRGAIVVPKPQSANMWAVAHAVLSHLDDEGEDHIRVIGARPGEKLHEDLVTRYERLRTVEHPNYMYINPPGAEFGGEFDFQDISSRDAARISSHRLAEWIADAVTV